MASKSSGSTAVCMRLELKPWLLLLASGFSGVTPNFFPWMVVWMGEHKNDTQDRREKMQRFLSVTDRVVAHKVWQFLSGIYCTAVNSLSYTSNLTTHALVVLHTLCLSI